MIIRSVGRQLERSWVRIEAAVVQVNIAGVYSVSFQGLNHSTRSGIPHLIPARQIRLACSYHMEYLEPHRRQTLMLVNGLLFGRHVRHSSVPAGDCDTAGGCGFAPLRLVLGRLSSDIVRVPDHVFSSIPTQPR